MTALLIVLLFATTFAASVWTLYVSVRPQLHRYRALFAPAAVLPGLPMQPSRVTVRWSSPVRTVARPQMRAAA